MPILVEAHPELLDASAGGYRPLPRITSSASVNTPPVHQHFDEQFIARLWHDYKIRGCSSARTQLIVHYMAGHVRRVAERLGAQLPKQVEVDDLVQAAYSGLVSCVESFDLEKNIKFETFSARRIKGAMRDYLRDLDDLPRLARQRFKLVQRIREDFYKHHGREPSQDELRVRLKELTPRKFRRMIADSTAATIVSFSSAGHRGGSSGSQRSDNDGDAMNGFEDVRTANPLTRAEREDLKTWLVAGFARRDRLIIILYYYEQMTMKDVGQTLGCSESRVSQRLEAIVMSLRSRLRRIGAEQELMTK